MTAPTARELREAAWVLRQLAASKGAGHAEHWKFSAADLMKAAS